MSSVSCCVLLALHLTAPMHRSTGSSRAYAILAEEHAMQIAVAMTIVRTQNARHLPSSAPVGSPKNYTFISHVMYGIPVSRQHFYTPLIEEKGMDAFTCAPNPAKELPTNRGPQADWRPLLCIERDNSPWLGLYHDPVASATTSGTFESYEAGKL